MAKEKSAKLAIKVNFGKKKDGKSKKSPNKHEVVKKYRGQGR